MENKITCTVEAVLEDNGVDYVSPDGITFKVNVKCDHGNYDVLLFCLEDLETLLVVVKLEVFVPEGKMDRMSSWIIDKNHSIYLGFFDLDTDDGAILFKLGCILDGGAVNPKLVESAIVNAVQTVDKAFGELVMTLYAGDSEKADDIDCRFLLSGKSTDIYS